MGATRRSSPVMRNALAIAAPLLLIVACGCDGKDRLAAVARSPSARWRPHDCQQVGRHGATMYLLCFRINRNEHGTFIAKRGSDERILAIRKPGPTPTATDAGRVGHWDWAALSPDGSTFLGQWSSECEIPIAFFARLDGTSVLPVTGEKDWARSPVSIAYGWTTDGRAIVRLPRNICAGIPSKRAGVYLISMAGWRLRIHPPHVIRKSTRPRPLATLRRS